MTAHVVPPQTVEDLLRRAADILDGECIAPTGGRISLAAFCGLDTARLREFAALAAPPAPGADAARLDELAALIRDAKHHGCTDVDVGLGTEPADERVYLHGGYANEWQGADVRAALDEAIRARCDVCPGQPLPPHLAAPRAGACDCGAALTQCADCAVADYQAAHPDCRACCPHAPTAPAPAVHHFACRAGECICGADEQAARGEAAAEVVARLREVAAGPTIRMVNGEEYVAVRADDLQHVLAARTREAYPGELAALREDKARLDILSLPTTSGRGTTIGVCAPGFLPGASLYYDGDTDAWDGATLRDCIDSLRDALVASPTPSADAIPPSSVDGREGPASRPGESAPPPLPSPVFTKPFMK